MAAILDQVVPPPGPTPALGLRPSLQVMAQELVDLYLHEVGRGRLSCDLLGKFCAAQPNPRPPIFDELAKLASRDGQNAERDLHRWVARQHWFRPLPPLFSFHVAKYPGGDDTGGPKEMQHECMLPHEVLASLSRASPVLLAHLFGRPEELLRFWAGEEKAANSHSRTSSWFQKVREWLGASALRATTIPLGLHGDDAGAHAEDNVTVLTWGSVAVDRPTWDTRLCFAMIRKSELVTGITFERLLSILAWSFRALARGAFPAEDDQGRAFGPEFHPWRAKLANTPLCPEGQRGLWVEMRGDWKFLREALHLTRHYSSGAECCHLCLASKTPGAQCSYLDFARSAVVRTTRVPDECPGGVAKTSPLPRGLPFFSIHRVFFDIMHTVDLGIYQVAVPSALAELTRRKPYGFPGRLLEHRVKGASAQYRAWCEAKHVRARTRRITEAWVKVRAGNKCPRISQKHCKAAALRRMVQWLALICQDALANDNSLHAQRRAALFASFWHADVLMRQAGRHMSAASAQELAATVEDALQLYKALSLEAGGGLWPLLPKHHALTHIAFDSAGTNPRRVHCYSDEDMVGKLKAIYIKCDARTAGHRALQRYQILQAIRWRGLAKRLGAPVYRKGLSSETRGGRH